MRTTLFKSIFTLLVLFQTSILFAQNTLSYSGRLVNSTGVPVTGTVNLKIDLAYTDTLNSNPPINICTKPAFPVTLSNGVFHVALSYSSAQCGGKTLAEVMQDIPNGETLVYQVTDTTNSKPYGYQAVHAIPSSVIAQTVKTIPKLGATTSGQILTWDGSKWAAASAPVSSGGTLTDLQAGTGITVSSIDGDTYAVAISNGGVDTAQLANAAVTDAKLASGISRSKIAAGTASHVLVNDGSGFMSSISLATLFSNLGLGTAAVANVGSSSGDVLGSGGITACLPTQKLQFTGSGPTWWSCITEDGLDSTKLPLTGGAMTGAIAMGSNKITGLGAPAVDTDAATKKYVDDTVSSGAQWSVSGGNLYRPTGNVGVGAAPTTKLEVAGTIRIGDGGETCAAGIAGGIRYSGANIQYCNGTSWTTLGVAGAGITALTGDVTASGNGSVAATIAASAVDSGKIADGSIATADVADSAITLGKLQNIATNRILGRSTTGSGIVEQITVGSGLNLTAGTLSVTFPTDSDSLIALGCTTSQMPFHNGTAWTCKSAVNTNTASAVVVRDASGDFSAADASLTSVFLRNGSFTAKVQAPTLAANYVLTLPVDDGTANQVLTTDGNGVLTWSSASAPGITALTGDVTAVGPGSAAATIAVDAVTTAKILDGTIATSDIAADAITSSKILDGTLATADLANDSVTYAKLQNVNTNKLLGRATALAGDAEEITLGTGLSYTGTTLNVTFPAAADQFAALGCTASQVPFFNGTTWACKSALDTNTNNAIVARDASGSFVATDAALTSSSYKNGSFTAKVQAPTLTSNYVLTLPVNDGNANQVLQTDGNGVLSWVTVNDTLGSLACTTGQVSYYNGTAWACKTQTDANTASTIVARDASGNFLAGDANLNGVGFRGGSFNIIMRAPSLAGNFNLTLPPNTGTANQVLTTDGTGVMTWTTPAAAGITALTGDVTGTGPGSTATTIANNAITSAKILDGSVANADLAANSVATGNIVDGTVATADVANSAVTFAKFQNVSTQILLGRSSAAAGLVEEITLGSGLTMNLGVLNVTDTVDNDALISLGCTTNQFPLHNGTAWTCSTISGGGDFFKDGSVAMTGQFKATNGSAAVPSISFAGSSGTGLYRPAADEIGVAINGTEKLRVDSTGRIGIGLSNLDLHGILQVNGDIGLKGSRTIRPSTNSDGDSLRFFGNQLVVGSAQSQATGYADGGLIAAKSSSDGALLLDVGRLGGGATNNGKLLVHNTALGNIKLSLTNANNDITFLADTISGFVGIGTNLPGAPLDVKGAIRLSGSTSGYTGFQPPAAAGSTIWTLPATDGASGQVLSTNGSGVLSWSNSAASSVTSLTGDVTGSGPGATATTIAANAVTSAKILDGTIANADLASNSVATGNIVDGTVATADLASNAVTYAKFQNVTSQILLGRSSALAGSVEEITLGSGLTMNLGILNVTDTVDNDALIALGCTTNQIPLHNGTAWTCSSMTGGDFYKDGSVAMTGQFKATDGTAAAPSVAFANSLGTGIYRAAASEIGFATGGSERLRLDSSGRLGIGVTPVQTLDVNGTAKIRSNILLGDNSTDHNMQVSTSSSGGFDYVTFTTRQAAGGFTFHPGRPGFRALAQGHETTFVIWNKDATSSSDTPAIKFNTNGDSYLNGTGNVGVGTTNPSVSLDVGTRTDAILVPRGTTSQRPSSPVNGMMRYNTTTNKMEFYAAGTWNNVIYTSGQTVPEGTGGTGYFVITNTSYNGNLGGLTGANTICRNHLTANNWKNKPGSLNTSKIFAFLCDSGGCQTPMPNGNFYYAVSGDDGVGGAVFATDSDGSGPGINGNRDYNPLNYNDRFGGHATGYWTGHRNWSDGGWNPANTNYASSGVCDGWTSSSNSVGGGYGTGTDSQWARYSSFGNTHACDTMKKLICYVNP